MARRGISENDLSKVFFNVCIDGRLDDCKSCKKDCKSKKCKKLDCQGKFDIIKETKPRPHTYYVNFFWNDGRQGDTSAYSQPIEGVYAIVDVRSQRVLRIVDTKQVIPYQNGNLDWTRPLDDTLTAINYSFPDGPSYTINGSQIDWQGWRFNMTFNSITNLEFHNVSFLDRTVWRVNPNTEPVRRPLYYKVNIPELITAYANPQEPVPAFNYLDYFEYPAREFVPPMRAGIDVPPYAEFINIPVVFADGTVDELPEAVAIYEVPDGLLWRHYNYPCGELGNDVQELYGRSGRNLVIQTIPVIGNYDYAVYYIFKQTGEMTVKIRATGIMSCIGTEVTHIGEHHEGHDEHHNSGADHHGVVAGTLVRERVNAVNHRHHACIRWDMMVDGLKTRVYEKEYEISEVGKENPCGNVFKEVERLLTSEKKAVRDHDFNKGRNWIVESSCSKTALGHHRGIEIVPSPCVIPASRNCGRIEKRATYMKHNFFVTKYHDGEHYAMGKHPIEKGKDEGLGKYIEDDERIVDKKNVVWYHTAFVHSPHVEQYPVMTYEELQVSARPHNFFDENPALYLSEVQDGLC